MPEEVLVTANELYAATREAQQVDKTDEELLEEWFEWFKKKGPSYLRDAVKKGLFRVTLDLPFQPTVLPSGKANGNSYTWKGKSLWKRLTEMLPGCKIEYLEEEYEEAEVSFPGYVLEISWKLKKKKRGFIVEESSVTTVPTTTSMTTTSMTTTSMTTTSMSTSSMMPTTPTMPSTSSDTTTITST